MIADYGRRHRYRVRNLHDGLPVPPVRLKRVTGHRPAYVGAADRLDAIVCRHGYVYAEGNQLGWVLLSRSRRGLGRRLEALRSIHGVAVTQSGDTEAAGEAPLETVDRLLHVLRPYRRRPPSAGRSAEALRSVQEDRSLVGAGIMAQESTQPASSEAKPPG